MADEALYAAKINGRHCAEHYETRMSNIKREQLGFSAKSIAAGMPGAFIVYKADEKGEIHVCKHGPCAAVQLQGLCRLP